MREINERRGGGRREGGGGEGEEMKDGEAAAEPE